jgi:hypothetical protein
MKVPVRQAAARAHLPKSTLHYRAARIAKPSAHKAGRPTALTVSQERAVIDLTVQQADGVWALTTSEVADAVAAIVSRMPVALRGSVRFVNGRPGHNFIKGFRGRRKDVIKLHRPRPQEAIRYVSTNADVLPSHFAALERIVCKNELDAPQIFTLDEVGFTPGKHVRGRTSVKTFPHAGQRADSLFPTFRNCSRVTMMPCISADGTYLPP